MIFYIIRRLLAAIPTLLAVLTLVFLIVRVVPGDPAIAILGDRATPEGVAALHAKLGLDKSIWQQYVDFLSQSLAGNFGNLLGTDLYDHHGGFPACVLATTIVYALILPALLLVPRRLIATPDGQFFTG